MPAPPSASAPPRARRRLELGSSSVVVAAFVGPGTVLTCASAGVGFGYALAWVLVFATAAVWVLQSLTAGTGLLAGRGLGEALRAAARTRVQRAATYGLVVLGLWIGCAAFEAGNVAGAAAGLAVVGAPLPPGMLALLVTAAAAGLLLLEVPRLTRVLTALVAVMSALFVAAAVLAPVDGAALLRGLAVPRVPAGSLVTVVALLGTTVVTYNLFLHPSAARRYWRGVEPRAAWRAELRGMLVLVPAGGAISLAILVAGAAAPGGAPTDVAGFAALLEPVAGPAARVVFGLGLVAAGLTSAVTAPLAAAAGIGELFGWTGARRRLVWATVLAAGLFFNLTGVSPLAVIVAAQAANGLLLPLVAGFVLYLTLRQDAVALPRWYAAAGAAVTLVCAGLGARTLWWVVGQL